MSDGVLRETPESGQMYRRIVDELAAVARAAGVPLPADVVDIVMKQAGGWHRRVLVAPSRPHAGQRLELEALTAHAVRLGQRTACRRRWSSRLRRPSRTRREARL